MNIGGPNICIFGKKKDGQEFYFNLFFVVDIGKFRNTFEFMRMNLYVYVEFY